MSWNNQNISVVVIDDTQINGQMVKDILKGSICNVKYFSDPHDGLRELMIFKPDVVLLDLDMPELNGVEILTQLRKMDSTTHQRVIMFTAHADLETVEMILKMKVEDYLVKPFKAVDLIRKLNHMFDRDIFQNT